MNNIKTDNSNIENNNMFISNNIKENEINSLNILQAQKIFQEDEKIPNNIGSYELIKILKDDGYSQIYLAKSKYTEDNVSIEIIKKSRFQECIEDLLLIVRKMEVLKVLKHRNILTLLEIYESPNFIYLVTEYLSGKNLIEIIISKKRFNESEAQKIFFQLVDALFYMHKMNICHRDLRTEHIIFDKNNTPKIIGFLYSTFYTKKQNLKDSFGSICYACPEIIQENSYDPELADVWSLGVILYVIVCGYLPFSEDNDESNKDLIIKGKIEYPKEISNKLKDLLKHMLDVNAKKRYNFIKIMKHPWFKPFNEDLLIGGCNLYKMIYPIDEKILNIIQLYGFDKKIVANDMKSNKYNIGTSLYKQLVLKVNGMGYKSISDLSSIDYIKYKNDKNKFYLDGDKIYNNYLEKIQEKIQKIEKVISDFQEKEDNIIQQLNNFQEMNLSLLNTNNEKEEKNKDNIIKKNDINADTKNDTKKSLRRSITPMFTIKESADKENNSSQFNNSEDNNQTKNNIILNMNKDDIINKRNINEKNKLIHSKSSPNLRYLINQLIAANIRCSYKLKNNHNYNDITASCSKWQDTSMFIRRKKNYLNNSSFLDNCLKKKNPRKSAFQNINQVIVEEENNNKKIEIRKSKQLRYSLSFGDDDEEEEDVNESSYISKIDSKHISLYDLDEELKVLRELKSPMLRSKSTCKYKKNSNSKKRLISNFGEKSNRKKSNYNNIIRIQNLLSNKFKDNPIIFSNKKNEVSFNNDDTDANNNNNNSINLNNTKSNNIKNNINKIVIPNNPIHNKKMSINTSKEPDKEINIFYIDNKKLPKISLNEKNTHLMIIDYIDQKEKELYSYIYYNNTSIIKKIDNININCSISEIEKLKVNKKNFLRNMANKYSKKKFFDRNTKTSDKIKIVKKNCEKTQNKIISNHRKECSKLKEAKLTNIKMKQNELYKDNKKNKKILNEIELKRKNNKSELKNKYIDELNFTNLSNLSEIKPLFINTHINNEFLENKENNIILYNCNIEKEKNQPLTYEKYSISNLTMTHENNITFSGGFPSNNLLISNSNSNNSNLNSESEEDTIKKKENTYNNNYILDMKRKKLEEKLRDEVKKSIVKHNIVTKGRLNTNNIDNESLNLDFPQSNGKKLRKKIIQSYSVLSLNDNNPLQNLIANDYNKNVPIRHYDLNKSKYIIKYINVVKNKKEKSVDVNKNYIRRKKELSEDKMISFKKQTKIQVNKSNKKSNGKPNTSIRKCFPSNYNNKTMNFVKPQDKDNNLVIKNLKCKCINGKPNNFKNNENIIVLSKHRKNFVVSEFSKFDSIPELVGSNEKENKKIIEKKNINIGKKTMKTQRITFNKSCEKTLIQDGKNIRTSQKAIINGNNIVYSCQKKNDSKQKILNFKKKLFF